MKRSGCDRERWREWGSDAQKEREEEMLMVGIRHRKRRGDVDGRNTTNGRGGGSGRT